MQQKSPSGRQYDWTSAYPTALLDEALELTVTLAARTLSPLSTVDLWPLRGALDYVPVGASAYSTYLLGLEVN